MHMADPKYHNDHPVLNHMELISMPSKHIFVDMSEIQQIMMGRRVQFIKLLGMGEIGVVNMKDKDIEWLEAREVLQLNLVSLMPVAVPGNMPSHPWNKATTMTTVVFFLGGCM